MNGVISALSCSGIKRMSPHGAGELRPPRILFSAAEASSAGLLYLNSCCLNQCVHKTRHDVDLHDVVSGEAVPCLGRDPAIGMFLREADSALISSVARTWKSTAVGVRRILLAARVPNALLLLSWVPHDLERRNVLSTISLTLSVWSGK